MGRKTSYSLTELVSENSQMVVSVKLIPMVALKLPTVKNKNSD
jgi:hypothetical protein